jgi:hypothetical protein
MSAHDGRADGPYALSVIEPAREPAAASHPEVAVPDRGVGLQLR